MKEIVEILVEEAKRLNKIKESKSYLSGWDPSAKNGKGAGWKSCTTTYTACCLIHFTDDDYMVAHLSKTIFDDGTVYDWHFKESILKTVESATIL